MKTLGYLIIAAVWFNKSTIFGPLVWKQLGLEAPWSIKMLLCWNFLRINQILFERDLIFGMWVYSDELPIKFVILSLLLRDLEKGETFASLLNIHGGDIRVVPTHLVYLYQDNKWETNHSEIKWWQLNIWPNFKVQGP
jgi:hypothetical protein